MNKSVYETEFVVKFKPAKKKKVKLMTLHIRNASGDNRNSLCGFPIPKRKINKHLSGHICKLCAKAGLKLCSTPRRPAMKAWIASWNELALLNQQRQNSPWLNNSGWEIVKPRQRIGAYRARR